MHTTPLSPTAPAGGGTAMPPPPLPLGPPPPLPTDGTPARSQLTQLFRDHKAALACQLLLELTAREANEELPAAFRTVEWAPNAFLLALAQWPANAPRNVFFSLVGVANDCMQERFQQNGVYPSVMVSDLAGRLLVDAFQDCRAHLCAAFVAAFHVSPVHLDVHCTRLVHRNVRLVVTVLDILGQRSLMPLEVIVLASIQQNDLEAADVFVRDSPTSQRVYVQMLIDRRIPDKIIKKRLLKFDIRDQEFPEYHARRVRASIRFLVYSQQFDDVLALTQQDSELQRYACHFVVENRGAQDPVARLYVYKSGLATRDEFAYVDTTGMENGTFPNKDDLEPLTNCLSVTELVGVDGCVFVDTVEGLDACVAHLRQASIVGFDCEWKTATSRDQNQEVCAVLQLASASRAFVIDMVALKGQCHGLPGIFRDESIVKLGFDTKGDVSVLSKVLPNDSDGHRRGGFEVHNLIDIQALAKRLKNVKKPRLKRDVNPVACGNDLEDGEIAETREAINEQAMDAHGDEQDAERISVATESPNREETSESTQRSKSVSVSKRASKKTKKRREDRSRENEVGDGSRLSLAAVAEEYMGKPLDKRSRMSDWERRPLTTAQLHYAALDALVLVKIFDEMRQRFPDQEFNNVLGCSGIEQNQEPLRYRDI